MEPSPWSTIWKNPRETIQRIVDTNPRYQLFLLIALGGTAQTLSNARGMGEMLPVSALIMVCIMSGPLSGFISIYLGGLILHWTSQKLGGTATREHIRTAMAWSWAPMVYTLPLWGVKYILFRDEMFRLERPFVDSHAVLSGLFDLMTMIDFAVFILYLYILFTGISQVNKFSFFRGASASVVSSMLLAIPMLLILYALQAAGFTF